MTASQNIQFHRSRIEFLITVQQGIAFSGPPSQENMQSPVEAIANPPVAFPKTDSTNEIIKRLYLPIVKDHQSYDWRWFNCTYKGKYLHRALLKIKLTWNIIRVLAKLSNLSTVIPLIERINVEPTLAHHWRTNTGLTRLSAF